MTRNGNRLPDRCNGVVGFTMLEVLVVMMIASVLLAIALPQLGALESRRAVANARNAFVWMSARARSAALERGEIVCLTVHRSQRRVEAETEDDGTVIDVVDYTAEYDVTITTSSGEDTSVCYSTRGIAMPGLGEVDESESVTVTFARGAETAQASVRPLGQVEAL